jgi:hypothetical protein
VSRPRLFAWATLVVAVVGSVIVGWAYLRSPSPSAPRRLQGSVVAAVSFDEPTDAWVSTSGTKVLHQSAGGEWVVGTYGVTGLEGELPVDEVSVLDDHRLYEVGSPTVLVIDSTQYELVDGVLVGGDCYWCTVPFPAQPVLADRHDGTWTVTINEKVLHVRQPKGWDGRPADAGLADDGGVVIVARLVDGETAVVDVGGTCVVEGSWAWVSAAADGVLLHRVDPARLDYTVDRVPRCA